MNGRPGVTARAVLDRLHAVSGFVSGSALSAELGLSRMAISKAVAQLRRQGYAIDAVPHCGYRLIHDTDQPRADAVQPLLRTVALGRAWVFHPEVTSTNQVAADCALAGAPAGLTVTAEAQTQGRGRLGRNWYSPGGRNLYVSVLLRPRVAAWRVPQVSLLAALAAHRALRHQCPTLEVAVKWPNDLWVGRRKLGGILCEMEAELDRVRHVIVGLGLNVNLGATDLPADLADRATSVFLERHTVLPRPPLLAAFLNALEPLLDQWVQADDLGPFLGELEAVSLLQGRRLRVDVGQRPVEGRALGLSVDGRLRLRTDAGAEVLIGSGEAHILGVD